MSWLEYGDLRERLRIVPRPDRVRATPLYVGEPGDVERAFGHARLRQLFAGLGLRPALGRFFRPAESRAPRRRAGGRDLARILADAARRRAAM